MPDRPEDPAARTRATYDAIADDFRDRTSGRSSQAEFFDRFAARVGPGGLVLDVGAGPGADAAELRRRGLRVIAIDLSLGMLRSGERAYPGDRVQADMAQLPFPKLADGLWVNAALLHVARARVPSVLAELRRVLHASGTLHLSVKHGTADGWETARYGSRHPRWFTHWTPETLDAALAGAGFRIVDAESRQGSLDLWLVRTCAPAGVRT
jgi:ubiquinone/menaquinone biosynthesis C-methylase UbiE